MCLFSISNMRWGAKRPSAKEIVKVRTCTLSKRPLEYRFGVSHEVHLSTIRLRTRYFQRSFAPLFRRVC